MISNAIAFYHSESGSVELVPQLFDIASLTRRIADDFEITAIEKQVELKLVGCDESLMIIGDEVLLRRLLVNLLDNATKFAVTGGSVTISIEKGQAVTIRVCDSAGAINSTEAGLLFRRFSQTLTGRKFSSSNGLGLYLCRQIAELHGGTISCTANPGVQTTFKLDPTDTE